LHIDNHGCRKAVQTLKQWYALPQATGHGFPIRDAHSHPASRIKSQPGNTIHGQLNGMMLSAGIIFLLGLSMHVSTIRSIQGNIQELAGASRDLRDLAAYSNELARVMEDRHNRREMARPDNPETGQSTTTAIVASLPRPVKLEEPGPNVEQSPPMPLQSGSDAYDRPAFERHAYGKWGPPLLLNVARGADGGGKQLVVPNDEDIQRDLLALGFDVHKDHTNGRTGTRILQALNEFRLLYLPASGRKTTPDDDQLTARIRKYAALARKDERKFSIDSGILAAIRLGSLRTGVEYSFLMELAATESSFDPSSVAPVTAAAGLYQFKGDTWLEAVRMYGKKYGMGAYASQVENYIDEAGNRRLRIHNPVVNEYVLALRYNPRISALLAAEYVKSNRKQLSTTLDHEPGHTEMYLTHFLGASGAISFLKALDENPDRIAGEVFPTAAEHNQALFHPKLGKPRTVAEIYKMFERKFSRSRYRDANPS
jgi:hypothetical protein